MALLIAGEQPDYRNRSDFTSFVAVGGGTTGGYVLASGVATLSAGVATVTNTNVLAARAILLTYYQVAGDVATVSYGTVIDGTSFVITSSSDVDTNKVSWAILQ